MSTTHRASILPVKSGKLVVQQRTTPKPESDEVLVRVTHAAIQQLDWKIIDFGYMITDFPAVLGSDASGVVESVGSGVSQFKKGDRVFWQGAYGAPYDKAVFQDLSIVQKDYVAKTPANISDAQAATIPAGLFAGLVGLFHSGAMNIPGPWAGKTASGPFVVLGGSSSVGQGAIQSARIAGFSPIITTAAEHNHAFLKELGATHTLGRDATVAEVEKIAAGEPIHYVIEAVSTKQTSELGQAILTAAAARSPSYKGTQVYFTPPFLAPQPTDSRISVKFAFGVGHARPDVGVPAWKVLSEWVEKGVVKPNNVELVEGLDNLPEAFDKSRKGISGKKVVVKL